MMHEHGISPAELPMYGEMGEDMIRLAGGETNSGASAFYHAEEDTPADTPAPVAEHNSTAAAAGGSGSGSGVASGGPVKVEWDQHDIPPYNADCYNSEDDYLAVLCEAFHCTKNDVMLFMRNGPHPFSSFQGIHVGVMGYLDSRDAENGR